jgi:radical SAM protein with 4Fe4S-binding SPASM domain
MDPKSKFKLFKQNKNFCAVPWTNFELYTNGDVKTCSYGRKIFGNINEKNIDEILQDKKMLELKQDMLDDIPNDNCTRCQDRNIKSERFEYLKGHYNYLVKNEDVDYSDIRNFDLRFIDLHWSNICNLRCVMCHPLQSSLIAKDLEVIVPSITKENIQSVTDMVIKNQYKLKEIYLSGGEPFYIPHNIKLLNLLENKEVPLRINTNMHWNYNNKLYEILKNFKNVQLTMSADAIEEKFEYIRNGASWNTFIENIKMVKKETNFQLRVNTIFSVINANNINELIDYFYNKLDVKDITINILYRPKEIDSRNYPANKKQHIVDKLYKTYNTINNNTNLKNNIQNCINQIQKTNLYNYNECLDKITVKHKKNWKEIFTDLI